MWRCHIGDSSVHFSPHIILLHHIPVAALLLRLKAPR
jgi:hypothetical protein